MQAGPGDASGHLGGQLVVASLQLGTEPVETHLAGGCGGRGESEQLGEHPSVFDDLLVVVLPDPNRAARCHHG